MGNNQRATVTVGKQQNQLNFMRHTKTANFTGNGQNNWIQRLCCVLCYLAVTTCRAVIALHALSTNIAFSTCNHFRRPFQITRESVNWAKNKRIMRFRAGFWCRLCFTQYNSMWQPHTSSAFQALCTCTHIFSERDQQFSNKTMQNAGRPQKSRHNAARSYYLLYQSRLWHLVLLNCLEHLWTLKSKNFVENQALASSTANLQRHFRGKTNIFRSVHTSSPFQALRACEHDICGLSQRITCKRCRIMKRNKLPRTRAKQRITSCSFDAWISLRARIALTTYKHA